MACQNLFSRRHRATNCFLIETFLQFRLLLPLSTCYFHFKKGAGKCGAVRVNTNFLIYLLNIQLDNRWKPWQQIHGEHFQAHLLLISFWQMPSHELMGFTNSSFPISATGLTSHTAHMYLSASTGLTLFCFNIIPLLKWFCQNMHIAREATIRICSNVSGVTWSNTS